MPVVKDLKQDRTNVIGDRSQTSVIEDQDVKLGQFGNQLRVATVDFRYLELGQQTRQTMVTCREAFKTRLVRERARQGGP